MTPALPDKEYFKIGEVAALVGVKPYVLRYWESEFKRDIRPVLTRSNQRMYRRRDEETFLEIKRLRYEEKLELPGARKRLRGGAKAVAAGVSDGLAVERAGDPSPDQLADRVDLIDPERTDRQRLNGPEAVGDAASSFSNNVAGGIAAGEVIGIDMLSGPALAEVRQSLEELLRIVDEDEKRG